MKKEGKGLSHSYYEGIDQALANLRLGVDYSWLWHFFDKEISKEQIFEYCEACYNLITWLKLPIGYSAYYIEITSQSISIRPITQTYQGYQIIHENKEWWKYYLKIPDRNPLRETYCKDAVKQARKFLKIILEMP